MGEDDDNRNKILKGEKGNQRKRERERERERENSLNK